MLQVVCHVHLGSVLVQGAPETPLNTGRRSEKKSTRRPSYNFITLTSLPQRDVHTISFDAQIWESSVMEGSGAGDGQEEKDYPQVVLYVHRAAFPGSHLLLFPRRKLCL